MNRFNMKRCHNGCYVSEDQERLLYVSKLLYPDIAKEYKTDWRAVEHSIRTVINILWKDNSDFLCFMAECQLSRRPAAGKFLAILYDFISNLDIEASQLN